MSGDSVFSILHPNKKKTKRAARPRKRARRQVAKIEGYALACANPFDLAVRGVRIPDSTTYPSATVMGTERSVATADANGNCVFSYFPYPNYCRDSGSTIAVGGVVTYAGTATAITQYTSLNSISHSFRVVGWGIRINCLSPITSAGGNLYVALTPDSSRQGSVFGRPTTIDEIISTPWHTIIPVSELCVKPMIIPGRIVDHSAFRYRENNQTMGIPAAADIESTTGHVFITCIGRDMPVGTRIQIEFVAHYEVTPRPNATIIDSFPSPHIPMAEEQARMVDIGVQIAYDAGKSAYSVASDAMQRAATMVGRSLVNSAMTSINSRLFGTMRRNYVTPLSFPQAIQSAAPAIEWMHVDEL